MQAICLTDTEKFLHHILHFLVHTLEVTVQQDFLLFIIFELIYFRERTILFFLVLNLLIIKGGLPELLVIPEFFRLLDVKMVKHTVIGSRKVTCRLSGQPACCHIRNLGCRNQKVHLLRDCG